MNRLTLLACASLLALAFAPQAQAGGGLHAGHKAAVMADKQRLAADKAQLRADKAAHNQAAVAADKARIQSDKAQLQADKAVPARVPASGTP